MWERYSLFFCAFYVGGRIVRMQVDKVINNNLIRSHDEKGQEVLVMGCGIGFKKKPGEYIDDGKVEKVYVLRKEERQHMEELFSSMPLECIQATNEIVEYATISLGKQLSNYLYLNLCDHIHFAIQRSKGGIPIQNALLTEIKRFYNHEYQIGMESLNIIERKTGVLLPEDEAGFIAMHLVNASMDFHDMGHTQEMMKITRLWKELISTIIIKKISPCSRKWDLRHSV